MREMHAVDINCIVRELQQILGSNVDKVFQDDRDVIRIRFYGASAGRNELLIESGKRIHLTQFRRKAPKRPTSFAMYLRKHLGNMNLTGVSQHDFDRVVLLEFQDLRLVVELFSRGNVILIDTNGKVMLSLKKGPQERVEKDVQYSLPEPPGSPFDFVGSGLGGCLKQKDLVRSLALDLGLGRLYANEACEATGLSKDITPDNLTDEQIDTIAKWIIRLQELITDIEKPVAYGEQKPVEYAPFELFSMEDEPRSWCDSFNEAADIYYSQGEIREKRSEAESARQKELERLQERLEIQRSQVQHLLSKSEELRKTADMVFTRYSDLKPLLTKASNETDSSEARIRDIVSREGTGVSYKGYDQRRGRLTVSLTGKNLTLDVSQSLEENAGRLYTKAKNMEEKAKGAKKAIRKTLIDMEKVKRSQVEEQKRIRGKPRKRKWYEKFRWFFTSSDILVIAGRDAKSNEILVRRYLEKHDLYAHADVQGAPSTVIKTEGQEVGEDILKEACAFALLHSKLWKSGTTAGDAYWVKPEQVTKEPTSGEYVGTGAFVIRGKRNYFRNLNVKCGVGWQGDRFMCGPFQAISKHCKDVLKIEPGYQKKSEIAKEIIKKLAPNSPHADLDQLIQVLPAGELRMQP